MRLIRYSDTELKTRGINHRVGTFRYRELGEGTPGTPGNFNLRMVWSEADFFSPRHRHNFDQVRVQIQGTFRFDADGSMEPGCVAFFPEGTPYGPQTSQDDTVQLVMQIGGASGSGYISETQRIRAVDALARSGAFRNGKYFANGADGGAGTDGFQAAWEQVQGKPMIYPAQRFQRPVLVDPGAVDWVPAPGAEAVDHKQIWSFGTRTVSVDLYRMAAGARLPLTGPLTCFVQHGTGRARAPREKVEFSPSDVMHLEAGESLLVEAGDNAGLLVFVHPRF